MFILIVIILFVCRLTNLVLNHDTKASANESINHSSFQGKPKLSVIKSKHTVVNVVAILFKFDILVVGETTFTADTGINGLKE